MSGPRAVALTVVSLAAAAGCGGGGTVGGPAPVRIGALVPLSGYGLGYYAAAFSAAVRSINAHGGVKGRPVQMDVCDDHSDPNQAQACARKLVSDGVIATAADVSELSMVEGPILDEAGIAQVGGEAVNPEDFTLPTAFPLDGGIFVQAAGGIIGARRRGLHSLFPVTIDTPAGRTLVGEVDQVAKAAGMDPAGAAYIPEAATDLLPYVQAAIQSKADVVFPGLPPSATIPFLVDSRLAGAHYLVMLPAGEFTPADIELMGGPQAVTENDILFAALPPISATDRFPALKTFTADMDAELAAGDRSAAPELRTGGSVASWLCVEIIARLAATLPVIDAAGILHALRTDPSVDTLGLTPPWSPGRSGPPTMPRVTNPFGYLSSQRNGVEVLTDPTPLNPLQFLRLGG
jgi:ABC-type branched-subunit amino acid transport system substrate-binding protein